MGSIRIGSSGWSYDDWIGPFYPHPTKQKDMLSNYFSRFSTIEVNSTFYRIPGSKTVGSWARECSSWEGREMTLKVPMEISHQLAMKESSDRMEREIRSFASSVLNILDDHGVLGAVLFQASPYFTVRSDIKYRMKAEPRVPLPEYILGTKRLEEICNCLREIPGEPAVELRNSAWLNEELRLREDAVDILRERGVALATVDGPSFPWFSEDTARHNYVRFHGRNKEGWFRSSENDTDARYDYEYSHEELMSRKEDILVMDSKVGEGTRIFFNNHPRGCAPRNALGLRSLLGLDPPAGAMDRFIGQ